MPTSPLPSQPSRTPSERIIFVDTSAIAAVMNETDQYHDLAVEQYKAIVANGYSLVLTTYVIAETHALLLNSTRNPALGRR